MTYHSRASHPRIDNSVYYYDWCGINYRLVFLYGLAAYRSTNWLAYGATRIR